MNLIVFGLFKKNVRQEQKQKESSDIDSGSDDSYNKEYDRLEKQREDSENIWEDRTYQLSAGGLSLTFAVFSFLMKQDNSIHFMWEMGVIWGGYTLCLILNYISHRMSISNFVDYIEKLEADRDNGKKYNVRVLTERYRCGDNCVSMLNRLTEILLVINIIFTVGYTISFFYNL